MGFTCVSVHHLLREKNLPDPKDCPTGSRSSACGFLDRFPGGLQQKNRRAAKHVLMPLQTKTISIGRASRKTFRMPRDELEKRFGWSTNDDRKNITRLAQAVPNKPTQQRRR